MGSILYDKLLRAPVYIEAPWEASKGKVQKEIGSSLFEKLLEQKLNEGGEVSFSKHAAERVVERGMGMSSENLERSNQGIKLAEERGLKEPLALLGSTAFVVNVKNNKVIAVVHEDGLKETVFTNIDGAAMI